jgi:hypothetical protein
MGDLGKALSKILYMERALDGSEKKEAMDHIMMDEE